MSHIDPGTISRRLFVTSSALGLLAACSRQSTAIAPNSRQVQEAEALRKRIGGVKDVSLTAMPSIVDLGGRKVSTWTYDGGLPGQAIRLTAGQTLRARVTNQLTEPTSVHWHGLAIRNDMDGVPGLTTPVINGNVTQVFEFVVPDPGTYWFHPHSGLQLDRGLYAPLIVDDPSELGDYDLEWIVVLDDWTDGAGRSPAAILADLKANGMKGMGASTASPTSGMDMGGMDMGGMDMGGMDMGGMDGMGTMSSDLLGGDAGDVEYPLYLLNGRSTNDPEVLRARPGQRVRIRVINAASDTAFRFALDKHVMRVTHTDGFPAEPVDVDQILIAMGERYDVTVTLRTGVFQLLALAEGKGVNSFARALIRTGPGRTPPDDLHPAGLTGRLLDITAVKATPAHRLSARTPDREHVLRLAGSMSRYVWTINGRTYDRTEPLPVQAGERVRLRFQNQSMMYHPMHVHGHTFELAGGAGAGARKDTTMVLPMREVAVDLEANNPGQWMIHCHNVYHMEAGMMTRLSYVT